MTRKRWGMIGAGLLALGILLGSWWYVAHLHPVYVREFPREHGLVFSADGYPVLARRPDAPEELPYPANPQQLPGQAFWLDETGRPIKSATVTCGDVRALTPSGRYLGWLEYRFRGSMGRGADAITLRSVTGSRLSIPTNDIDREGYISGPGFTSLLSHPRLRLFDNLYSIIFSDDSTLRDPSGKVVLRFHGNDRTTQFTELACSDPRYVPLVHGMTAWMTEEIRMPMGSIARRDNLRYSLYDTLAQKEISLPISEEKPRMVLMRDDVMIILPQRGRAAVIDRQTKATRYVGPLGKPWHTTADGTCWIDGVRRKPRVALLDWRHGTVTLRHTNIPMSRDDLTQFTAAFWRDDTLAATAVSTLGKQEKQGQYHGRRTVTLYRRGRPAGTFSVPFSTPTTLAIPFERLAFSPDGRHLAWCCDRGQGTISLYVFNVQ